MDSAPGRLRHRMPIVIAAATALAVVAAACVTARQSTEPSRRPMRDGTVWPVTCDSEATRAVCEEIFYLAGDTVEYATGHRVTPARLSVDGDGIVVFESRRRTEDPPKWAKIILDYVIDPAGRTPEPGLPDWRRLPARRRGEAFTLRYVGRTPLASYEITVRLDPRGGGGTLIQSVIRAVPVGA